MKLIFVLLCMIDYVFLIRDVFVFCLFLVRDVEVVFFMFELIYNLNFLIDMAEIDII